MSCSFNGRRKNRVFPGNASFFFFQPQSHYGNSREEEHQLKNIAD
jgi:hypothetical protein